MATSIFLAKLIGPVALALGVALLVNGAAFRAMADEFLASRALIFLSGIAHPAGRPRDRADPQCLDAADWRVLITLARLAGDRRRRGPHDRAAAGRGHGARKMFANPMTPKIGAAIWLAVGAILCFFGYFR